MPFTAPDPLGVIGEGDVLDLAGMFNEFAGTSEIMAYGWQEVGTGITPLDELVAVADLVDPLPGPEAGNDRFVQDSGTGEVTDPIDPGDGGVIRFRCKVR